jgi:hypothetical protein
MSNDIGKPRYIYICSAGHSGSTLLDLLIGSHPRIASLGEIDQLSKNFALDTECSCGARVRTCAVWCEVARRVGEAKGIDVLAHPYKLHMGYPKASVVIDRSHQTPAYLARREFVLGLYYLYLKSGGRVPESVVRPVIAAVDNNVLVFESVRQVLGVDAIVDSSKSYLKAVAMYRRHPDRVRVLLLTRDGRGVYWSNLKRGTPRARVVRDWCNQYSRALPLLRQHVHPAHLMQVRYEDLAAGTEAELRRVCDDMRLAHSSEVRLDEAWRSRLAADDLAFFEARAGALNRQLGYT